MAKRKPKDAPAVDELHAQLALLDNEMERQQLLYRTASLVRESFVMRYQALLAHLVPLEAHKAALETAIRELEAQGFAARAALDAEVQASQLHIAQAQADAEAALARLYAIRQEETLALAGLKPVTDELAWQQQLHNDIAGLEARLEGLEVAALAKEEEAAQRASEAEGRVAEAERRLGQLRERLMV